MRRRKIMPLVIAFLLAAVVPTLVKTEPPVLLESPLVVWTETDIVVPCLHSREVQTFLNEESAALILDRILFQKFRSEPCREEERVTLYALVFTCRDEMRSRNYCLTESAIEATMRGYLYRPAFLRDYLAYARLASPSRPREHLTVGSVVYDPTFEQKRPIGFVRTNTMVADWGKKTPVDGAERPEVYFREESIFLARRLFPRP
jgi:hypothetical protein